MKQFIADLKWALMMRRVRAYRRGLSFGKRRIFDDMLRPPAGEWMAQTIAYPDAFYSVTPADVGRAVLWSQRP